MPKALAALLVLFLIVSQVRAQTAPPVLVPQQQSKGALLGWMIQSGKLSRKIDNGRLLRLLRRGEVLYLDGASRAAANLFGALLLDPSFWELAKTPVHDNIRYDLAGALQQEAAYSRARTILMSLVKREPPSAFRAPSFRKLVDLTLESEQYEQGLSGLQTLKVSAEERDELNYLKGRALIKLGFAEQAVAALQEISRHSRFRAPALYLLAALALERGDSDQATTHLCSIVDQPGGSKYTFLVSRNTLEVIDQAWLALARIRHDAGAYRRAVETYAMLQPQSPQHATARYESAWSLFRMGRTGDTMRKLTEHFREKPLGTDWPMARLLLGYAYLSDCLFDLARAEFDELAQQFGRLPVPSPEMSQRIGELPAIARRVRAAVPASSEEARALNLLLAFQDSHERSLWARAMIRKLASGMPMKAPRRPGASLAHSLQADISRAESLAQRIADMQSMLEDPQRIRELEIMSQQVSGAHRRVKKALETLDRGRTGLPLGNMSLVDGSKQPKAYLQAEGRGLGELGRRILDGRVRARELANQARKSWWFRAASKAASWKRLATIGHIDTALGKKQALELEVQNLAQGRYPFSLFRELARAGLIDETQEYWPYDGEGWPDEVEAR